MKKHHNALTEHYLIPAVLFLLNICLAHLIHALASGTMYSSSEKLLLALAFVLLGSSLLLKKRFYLVGAILFYGGMVLLG